MNSETEKQVPYADFEAFYKMANDYIVKFPKERSVLTYALNVKFLDKHKKALTAISAKLQEKRADLDAEHALKDKETGAFLEQKVSIGSGEKAGVVFRKTFDKKGESTVLTEFKDYKKTVDDELYKFEPYFVDVPRNIDIKYLKAFTGFVFKPMTEKEEIDWYLAQNQPVILLPVTGK